MNQYHYAIIIPAWNEAQFIESSVAAALSAMHQVLETQQVTGQLIVVDNNSSDETAKLARDAGAQVVFEPVNQIARARNAGAAAASAPLYVFVDADSQLSFALLQTALTALNSNEVVGGGCHVSPDRDVPRTVRNGIATWNRISSTFKWAAGCFVFCRADAFHEVGGFTLKRYAGEELVLSRVLRRWGRRRGLRFEIITEHTMPTSMRKMDWYSSGQLFKQMIMVMIPGALGSKRFMSTWYDDSTKRTRDD